MKRFMTTSIASILVLLPVASLASAWMAGAGGNSSAVTRVSALGDDGTDWRIRHWKGKPFTVVPVDNIYSNGEVAAIKAQGSEKKRVHALQSAIKDNHALRTELKADHVELRNVIDADTAMNGKIIFYVR
jgi:hypothetical protein